MRPGFAAVTFLAILVALFSHASLCSAVRLENCKGRNKLCQKKCAREQLGAFWSCACLIAYDPVIVGLSRNGDKSACEEECRCVRQDGYSQKVMDLSGDTGANGYQRPDECAGPTNYDCQIQCDSADVRRRCVDGQAICQCGNDIAPPLGSSDNFRPIGMKWDGCEGPTDTECSQKCGGQPGTRHCLDGRASCICSGFS